MIYSPILLLPIPADNLAQKSQKISNLLSGLLEFLWPAVLFIASPADREVARVPDCVRYEGVTEATGTENHTGVVSILWKSGE